MTPQQAAEWLSGRNAVIGRLSKLAGPPKFPKSNEPYFAVLVRIITQQQLAGPAARAIHGRLVAALGGTVTPEQLDTISDETMRACGLSGRKVASLRDLAGRISDGSLRLGARSLSHESDEEIVAQLSAVRGIGKWTAEMFLMFQLRRLDVWPTDDLELRKGYAKAWQVELPKPKQLDALGDEFRPYRSIAAWYCWTANRLDLDEGTGAAK